MANDIINYRGEEDEEVVRVWTTVYYTLGSGALAKYTRHLAMTLCHAVTCIS